jgi:RND family efflux transporter MFP subunit
MIFRNILLSIITLALGISVSIKLVKMKPKAIKKPKINLGVLVERQNFIPQEEVMIVNGLGVVAAAKSITLTPQVTGIVRKVSDRLTVGSLVKKGDLLLSIEATDYQVTVQEAQARVDIAQQEVKLEKGRAQVAKKEWEIMRKRSKKRKIEAEAKARALREPQTAIAQAQLRVAKAALKRARINLGRTKIKAPFNAMVVTETVDRGQFVGPTQSIARLVGSDAFWITTPIASDDLRWIDLPQQEKDGVQVQGSVVKVIYDLGHRSISYDGYVIRQLYEIESTGRMTRLLIEVPKPLHNDNQRHALPLGAQVQVEIMGKKIKNLYKVPRTVIRNENQIWIFDKAKNQGGENTLLPTLALKEKIIKGRLRVKNIEVIRKLKDHVLIQKGLSEQEQVITSRIATPVPNMQIRASTHRRIHRRLPPASTER